MLLFNNMGLVKGAGAWLKKPTKHSMQISDTDGKQEGTFAPPTGLWDWRNQVFFFFFNWSVIALLCCVSFSCITM